MLNSYDTNFDAPDAHFDNLYLISDAQAEKWGNPKYNDCKDPNKPNRLQTDVKMFYPIVATHKPRGP
jgi:hypothetical protein